MKVRRTAIDNVPQPELAALQPVLDSWAEPVPKLKASKKKRTLVQDWKMADLEGDLATGRARRAISRKARTRSSPRNA